LQQGLLDILAVDVISDVLVMRRTSLIWSGRVLL